MHSSTGLWLGKCAHTCTHFQTLSPHSYLLPLILLWWQQTFSIWRATSDGVWWQIWEASGGSVWLCDEKSAVIQEPSVILPSKEHGLHPPGFRPLPAHTANEEWQFLAMSVFLLSFSFGIFLTLPGSLLLCLTLSDIGAVTVNATLYPANMHVLFLRGSMLVALQYVLIINSLIEPFCSTAIFARFCNLFRLSWICINYVLLMIWSFIRLFINNNPPLRP